MDGKLTPIINALSAVCDGRSTHQIFPDLLTSVERRSDDMFAVVGPQVDVQHGRGTRVDGLDTP
jgi:hypothetical protein